MLRLCKSWFAIVVGLLLSSSILVAEDKSKKKETLFEKTAKAFVALLDKGEFERATCDFDEAMLKALPADKLKGAWEKVVGDAGAFKKQLVHSGAGIGSLQTGQRVMLVGGVGMASVGIEIGDIGVSAILSLQQREPVGQLVRGDHSPAAVSSEGAGGEQSDAVARIA